MTIDAPVLVLNQNYEPLNVARVRRAVVLMLRGKAEMLENGTGEIHMASGTLPLPSVIRLVYLVKRPYQEKKLSRYEIFQRDRYRCQYCGVETRNLTLDHIVPRHRGGQHAWENVVSACHRCNSRKAGRTPQEAGMNLIAKPCVPKLSGYCVPYEYLRRYDGWRKFLPSHQESNVC